MNTKEREILKKAVDSNEGQISPATMINGYAGGDQGIVERLVSQGYLERVYQFREGLHNATYSIIFYAVTEKGVIQFKPILQRIWFNFKNQTALYVGVTSIIFGLVTSVTSWYTIQSSLKANIINEQTSQLEYDNNQPFLIIAGGNTDATDVIIQNAGGGPAKNIFFLKHYTTASSTDAFILSKDSEVKLALAAGQTGGVNLNEKAMVHFENKSDILSIIPCATDDFLSQQGNWVAAFYENIRGERFISRFNGRGSPYGDGVNFIRLSC